MTVSLHNLPPLWFSLYSFCLQLLLILQSGFIKFKGCSLFIIIFEECIGIDHSLKAIQSYKDVTFFMEIHSGKKYFKKNPFYQLFQFPVKIHFRRLLPNHSKVFALIITKFKSRKVKLLFFHSVQKESTAGQQSGQWYLNFVWFKN